VQQRNITVAGRARMKLQLDDGIELPTDTTVAIRTNGLLGARYVELIPGRAGSTLPDGATIRGGPNALTFGVPEVLDTFDRDTRGGLGTLLRETGKGLLGNGAGVNGMIGAIDAEVRPVRATIKAILARRGAAGRLVPALDAGVAPLARNRDALTRQFGVGADALQPFADGDVELRATIAQAPSTLRSADLGLTNGRRLLAALTSLTRQVVATLPPAPAGLRAATALLHDSHVPLRRAEGLLRRVPAASSSALRVTGALNPVLAPIGRSLGDLDPMLRQIGRYGCDLANFGAVFRSMTGFGGIGDGPNGPAGEFRVQVAVPTLGMPLGVSEPLKTIGHRETYARPCQHLASAYPVSSLRPGGSR
jgi:ABC-type transporter Mla subunit MlaD